jgi:hypothetical protein
VYEKEKCDSWCKGFQMHSQVFSSDAAAAAITQMALKNLDMV